MKPTSTLVQMDQKEEETLSFEVSDEALESAAVTEMAALTLALCTGLNGLPVLVMVRITPARRFKILVTKIEARDK